MVTRESILRPARRRLPWLLLVSGMLSWVPLAGAQVRGGADSVTVRAIAARTEVHPGDLVPIAVVLEHAAGFHSWPHTPVLPPAYQDVVPIPTTIEVIELPEGATTDDIQWPVPVSITVRYTGRPVDLLSYAGTAVAYLPLTLAASQPVGQTTVGLRVRYQSCDERICYPPRDVDLSVPLLVVATGTETSAVNEPHVFAAFGLDRLGARPGLVIPAYISVFGWSFTFEPTGFGGRVLLLVLAALGGLLLNLTPCVLPLVPIKVMGLRSVAGSPRRLVVLGTAMGIGVVAFWVLLGGAIGFIAGFDAISSLFQTGWFAPVVGIVVGIAGLGMLGVFDIRLPQGVYRVDPSAESVPGSFAFGVMTAVLSTPCTAPFMGGAAAWAVLQRPAITLSTFGAIGAGMALPYVLLTFWPRLVSRVPRSGPGSVLLKQIIGLFMLAVAMFFIGGAVAAALHEPPDPPARGFWWLVGGLVVVAFAWLTYRVPLVTSSRGWRIGLRAGAVALMLLTVLTTRSLASHGPIEWVGYTPERFEAARERGAVIVMDFTAEWCLNCKALESAVLYRKRVVKVFESPGVVPMRVDLTTSNPAGQAKLKELGWVGIPLLAVFGPGVGYTEPIRYDSYTARMVEDAVSLATSGR